MTTFARGAAILLLILMSAPIATARTHETGFLNRTVTLAGVTYRYQVYVPANWDNSKKWPVILSLHGSGERGDDGLLQTEVGIGTALRRRSPQHPFIVVMPQCLDNHSWLEPAMQQQAMTALEQSIKEFKGDRDRLYLSGLSMGGYGTWSLAVLYPEKFAAYVPICGGINGPPKHPQLHVPLVDDHSIADPYAETAKRIGHTPVWIFHGAKDDSVPVEESRKMANALKNSGANFRYTEYPDAGHNSWDKAYAEAELVPWLLQQKLQR